MLKRTRFLALLGGALALALALPGAASAQTPPGLRAPAGPVTVVASSGYGYYIWFDGERVHLRTTDPGGDGSLYTGTVEVNGRIRDVNLFQPEPVDSAIRDANTLRFRFHTANHVDGVDFTAVGASRITFRLERNGHLISEDRIFLGAHGGNPPGNPFTIYR